LPGTRQEGEQAHGQAWLFQLWQARTSGTYLQGEVMSTIQEKFEQFHLDNPQVYAKLVELAVTARDAGATKIGIGFLWERLRWHYLVEVVNREGDEFKLNNDFRSRYARLIRANNPNLAPLFEVRQLRAA
jgi:hypothetical protein